MFEIGLRDTITITKSVANGKDSEGNPKYTVSILINNQECRMVTEEKILVDQTGARITVEKTKVLINYTGTDIDDDCIATINSIKYVVITIKPAKGFGQDFKEIEVKLIK